MSKKRSFMIGLMAVIIMALLTACVPAATQPLEPNAGQTESQEAADPVDPVGQDETEVETLTPPPAGGEEENVDQKGSTSDQEKIEIRETMASEPASEPLDQGSEEAGAVPGAPPITGEVPEDIMANIMADLNTRVTLDVDQADQGQVVVRRAEAVVFPDGSLGCPQPGEFYTMALVSGYVVEIEVEGQVYDYRVNNNGFFRLCENSRPFVPIEGTPNS